MSSNQNDIPRRENNKGESEVETRPMYVEEWLDSLPYIDFDKTTSLLNDALRETNAVTMKPSQRIELITEYNRPYRYYIDSQIKLGSNHTLSSMETLKGQAHALKKLSVALAMACRIAIEETLNQKTLWIQSKPPLEAIMMAMTYLSHTLIFSYLEYAPVPKNIWREINFLYDFSEGINKADTLLYEISDSKDKKRYSIAATYKRIILTSMVDPHHLPFGAVWEIYSQLEDWVDDAELLDYKELNDGAGFFVVDLKNDVHPVAYSKFNTDKAKNRKLKLLDANKIIDKVQTQLGLLQKGKGLDESVQLSSHYAKTVLTQMEHGWHMPAQRKHKRELRKGKIKMAIGLNSCHFFLNEEKPFTANQQQAPEEDDIDNMITEVTGDFTVDYSLENWQLIDQSGGGIAISLESKHENPIRVGEVVAVAAGNGQYLLGVVRWLMIRSQTIYKAGVEVISKKTIAASIRLPGETNPYQRALILETVNNNNTSVLTAQGFYHQNQLIDLNLNDKVQQHTINALVESSSILEQFSVN